MLLLIYWWHNTRGGGGGGGGWRRWRRCWVGAGVRWLLPCTCVFTHLFHLQVVSHTHTHAVQYVATVTLKDQRGPFKSVSRHTLHVSHHLLSRQKNNKTKKKKGPPVELPMELACFSFFLFPSDATQKNIFQNRKKKKRSTPVCIIRMKMSGFKAAEK